MENVTASTTEGLWWAHSLTNLTTSAMGNTTFMSNNTYDHPLVSASVMAIYFSIRLIFSTLAIFGNLLTIVAVFRYERLQTTTNFLICSLAAADMLGGSLTPLNMIHHYLPDGAIFIPVCLIDKTLSVISVGTNLLSILWIAIDRYCYIAHPLHYPLWVNRTKTFLVIGLTWFILVTELTGIFVFANKLKIGMTCKFPVFLRRFVYGNILLPQMASVAVLTVAFYVAIARIAHKQGQAIAALNQPYDTYEAAMNRQQKKIAKMMIMVLGTYFLCYIPQVIATIIMSVNRTTFWSQVEIFTVVIYWANTWLNPLIYAWKSEDFRVSFRKLLGLKPRNAVDPSINH